MSAYFPTSLTTPMVRYTSAPPFTSAPPTCLCTRKWKKETGKEEKRTRKVRPIQFSGVTRVGASALEAGVLLWGRRGRVLTHIHRWCARIHRCGLAAESCCRRNARVKNQRRELFCECLSNICATRTARCAAQHAAMQQHPPRQRAVALTFESPQQARTRLKIDRVEEDGNLEPLWRARAGTYRQGRVRSAIQICANVRLRGHHQNRTPHQHFRLLLLFFPPFRWMDFAIVFAKQITQRKIVQVVLYAQRAASSGFLV